MEHQEPFDVDVKTLRALIQKEVLADHERRLQSPRRLHLLTFIALLLLGAALLAILVASRAHA